MRVALRPMPLGEDILLARHGDRIVEMTQDRKNQLTIARLVDGSIDSASNYLVNIKEMMALTPAERMNNLAGDYSADRLQISRQDIKFMMRISALWTAASAVVIGGMTWAIYTYGDAESLTFMMSQGF
ncbi:hypothetical protein [Arthrobacter sp. MYb227]|uniref:hypothetical protein n=1 Tax=Arthrobacter sp. MYb227 TaxID=1848601 RepID=UPI0011B08613|nr:hypothetical protein [Arthrobacter sp. MYb227]